MRNQPTSFHTPSAGLLMSYSPRRNPIPYPRSVSPSPTTARHSPQPNDTDSETDSGSEETMSNSASDTGPEVNRFTGGIQATPITQTPKPGPSPFLRVVRATGGVDPQNIQKNPSKPPRASDTEVELTQIFHDSQSESDSESSSSSKQPNTQEEKKGKPDRGDAIDYDVAKNFKFLKYLMGDMREISDWLRQKPMFPYFPIILLDRILRSIAQVAFQNNPLCGLVILAALIGGNPFTGVCVLIGASICSMIMMALKVSEEDSIQGLHGFNGCLVSGAFSLFVNARSAWDPLTMVWVVIGPACCIVVEQAVAVITKPLNVPGFTLPAVLTTYMFLFSTYQSTWWNLTNLPNGGSLVLDNNISSSGQQISVSTLYQGVFNSFSQVWFVENWISGLFILFAIGLCDIRSGVSALLGAIVGLFGALIYGGSESSIRAGLWGYNTVLASISVFPVLYQPSFKSALYGAACASFCVVLTSAIRSFMIPYGLPALTLGFVLSAQVFVLAAQRIPQLPPKHSPGP